MEGQTPATPQHPQKQAIREGATDRKQKRPNQNGCVEASGHATTEQDNALCFGLKSGFYTPTCRKHVTNAVELSKDN